MKKLFIFLIILFIPINIKAIDTSVQSAILMDMDSNRIIYAKNINEVRSVASISKIMTCIVALESGKLYDNVTIGDEIKKAYGSAIYLSVGEELRLIDLLYGLMLRSGNDAANSIATFVSGDIELFVALMNDKAHELGMKNTTFNNPSGLDSNKGNYSTSYDMALLTSYAMKNKDYQKITSTKEYRLKTNMNNYLWSNKNKLLKSYKYTTGGKTGYTEIAKRTLVTTASKNNTNLVIVTLNDSNDFVNHKRLYEEYFELYKNYVILKKGNIEIIGEKYYSNVNYYLKEGFTYLLNENEKDSIILKFELEKKLNYKNNEKIGIAKVLLKDKEIFRTDVYIEIKKEKINVWKMIKGWFND